MIAFERFRHSKILATVVLAVGAFTALGACSTTPETDVGPFGSPTAEDVASSQPGLPEHWQLVEVDPPTFHPDGMPDDAPTSHWDGEWVVARHGGGEWVVPWKDAGEIPRKQLPEDAVTWRDAVQKLQKKRRRQRNPAGHVGEAVAKTAISATTLSLFAGALIGGVVPDDDSYPLITSDVIPEPSQVAILGLGILGFCLRRRR